MKSKHPPFVKAECSIRKPLSDKELETNSYYICRNAWNYSSLLFKMFYISISVIIFMSHSKETFPYKILGICLFSVANVDCC